MAENYTVAARLEMSSNAGQVTTQLMEQFSRLNREIRATQENLSRFTTDLRAFRSGASGINAMVASLDRLGKARMGTGFVQDLERMTKAGAELEAVQAGLARSAAETATAYKEMAAASRSMPKAPAGGARTASTAGAATATRPSRAGHGDLMMAGIGAQQGGGEGWSLFTKSIMAEAEVSNQLASLRMNNTIGDADIAKARGVAERIARETPGTTIAENLHHITDAFTVMGDLNEALAGAPAVARMAYVLKNLPGQHKGDSSFAAQQSIEVMQRFYDPKTHQVDMNAFNQQLALMTQVATGTGGRVDGSSYLGFAKQSRIGGMTANDAFLYRDLPAMLIALGGSRAGTGEAATFQQFITGRMTEAAANQLKKAGLLDKSAKWKGGQVGDMQHKFQGFETYGANPVEWVREFMLGPQGALARNKVDPNDKLALAKFLSDWSGRQTGLGFMSEMTLGMGGINKEGGKLGNTTTDPMKVLQQSDPMQKLREFHAAENELMVTFGQNAIGPALEALKALTNVIRDLSDWGKSHPNAAKDITLVVGGLAALATAAGNAAMAIFIGAPLVKGLGALAEAASPFGAAGAAGVALAGLPGLLGGLAAAVIGLPVLLKGVADAMGETGGHKGSGKGLQAPGFISPPPPPDSTGNHFGDWLRDKWTGFRDQPTYSGQGAGKNLHPTAGQPVTMSGVLNIDGKKAGNFIAQGMSGPNTGITGNDIRSGYHGAMAHP